MDKNYHIAKLNICKSNGIKFIQIFEDEWVHIGKREIVKSRLKSILNNLSNIKIVYARNCIIKEIPTQIKNNFLNIHHLQGSDSSNINLGGIL